MADFGFSCIETSGHNLLEIEDDVEEMTKDSVYNWFVIAHTQKGNGISCIENTNTAHAGPLPPSMYIAAVEEIRARIPGVKVYETEEKHRPVNTYYIGQIRNYSEALAGIVNADDNIMVLDADLESDCGLSKVAKEHPDQFLQFGISEQDMVSTAGGLALAGKIPIMHSFAAFLCRRANEQIYNNCTEGTHIIYVGFLAGKLTPGPGPSHECINDIEIMHTMPGMTILEPNSGDVAECLHYAIYQCAGPVYISIKQSMLNFK